MLQIIVNNARYNHFLSQEVPDIRFYEDFKCVFWSEKTVSQPMITKSTMFYHVWENIYQTGHLIWWYDSYQSKSSKHIWKKEILLEVGKKKKPKQNIHTHTHTHTQNLMERLIGLRNRWITQKPQSINSLCDLIKVSLNWAVMQL